ncbi:YaeQ family protein [Oceanicoccus sp. KOV_DT_Chl]|uniref:YaeQ family protein n=1 Tax=Oceanicoccus sp. KOV_DT_Chl TaxID=1904639 RepID=UPI000C7BE296|nr:YaeQ family protein [Oceanicoccus sp. KOV_DT_Chl]
MALKPTIYKANIALSDMDRELYDTLSLTIAQHPSETLERMMVRVLAFCLNARAGLQFTKGLSTPDEPDIVARELDDQFALWIDVGEPLPERIKKATRIAKIVKVYSFNSKSSVWWQQNQQKFRDLNVAVFQLPWEEVQALAGLVQRTMDFSLTVTEGTVYVSGDVLGCELQLVQLQ